MHTLNLALSYLISNEKYMDFLLFNPIFYFHATLYINQIVNFITYFTVHVRVDKIFLPLT